MAYPTLNQNKIFAALYNQIISIDTFADNIKGTYSELVDKARVDGGLYGDTKVYLSTDVLKSAPWGNDAEATNLLALHRPPQPKTQTITLDQFRQICLTVDNNPVALYVYAKEQGEFGVAFAIAAILMALTLLINFAAGLVQKHFAKRRNL